MKQMEQSLVKIESSSAPSFSDSQSFEHAQRVAKMLSSSNLIPKDYQGNIQNTMIALEMANRIGATPLMVMQNLYIIHGKPSWSSSFIIAAINACKKFSPLRFSVSGEGDGLGCFAWAYDIETKDKLEGPAITIGMAKKEGWFTKTGSKWQTMPELMLRYRSAAFFGRLYAPEILMGMHTTEEIQDVVESHGQTKIDKEAERIQLLISDCTTKEELENLKPYVMESQLDLFNSKLQEVEK
jgi:hypothetical protein